MRRRVYLALILSSSVLLSTAGVLWVPHMTRKRIKRNQAAIHLFMKKIPYTQAVFQVVGIRDRDKDAHGEYARSISWIPKRPWGLNNRIINKII